MEEEKLDEGNKARVTANQGNSSIHCFFDAIKIIRPADTEVNSKLVAFLSNTPFWVFIKSCLDGTIDPLEHKNYGQSIDVILPKYNRTTNKFNLGGGKVGEISDKDVAELLGLELRDGMLEISQIIMEQIKRSHLLYKITLRRNKKLRLIFTNSIFLGDCHIASTALQENLPETFGDRAVARGKDGCGTDGAGNGGEDGGGGLPMHIENQPIHSRRRRPRLVDNVSNEHSRDANQTPTYAPTQVLILIVLYNPKYLVLLKIYIDSVINCGDLYMETQFPSYLDELRESDRGINEQFTTPVNASIRDLNTHLETQFKSYLDELREIDRRKDEEFMTQFKSYLDELREIDRRRDE
ncbi:hypothetical protein LWI29_018856 [Acer saccharum]|uniref:Uncharacterized protein n=1 Tax=Acer saccharum TaxID=4024 RepID=A0AA39RHY3_ACESA|nr:hypothetical protein LWI29_018856 [Acer saccharum]